MSDNITDNPFEGIPLMTPEEVQEIIESIPPEDRELILSQIDYIVIASDIQPIDDEEDKNEGYLDVE